jgi:hypothetical protein
VIRVSSDAIWVQQKTGTYILRPSELNCHDASKWNDDKVFVDRIRPLKANRNVDYLSFYNVLILSQNGAFIVNLLRIV